MRTTHRELKAQKNIALVAHDHCKDSLLKWCGDNKSKLAPHKLYATGTTGNLIAKQTGLEIDPLLSGPMGGDQQLGSMIATKQIDMLIFFWDPMNAVPHDPDVKALWRIATVWNIPVAINVSSANMMIQSPDFDHTVEIEIPDYDNYLKERLDKLD